MPSKLEIKLIENKKRRQRIYSKRRRTMLKRARELTTMCDVDIAMIMFSPSGRLATFASGDRMKEIIERYANIGRKRMAKEKPETAEFLKKVKKLSDGGDFKAPRRSQKIAPMPGHSVMDYVKLQLQIEELRNNLENLRDERDFYQKKSRFRGGTGLLNDFSLQELAKINEEMVGILAEAHNSSHAEGSSGTLSAQPTELSTTSSGTLSTQPSELSTTSSGTLFAQPTELSTTPSPIVASAAQSPPFMHNMSDLNLPTPNPAEAPSSFHTEGSYGGSQNVDCKASKIKMEVAAGNRLTGGTAYQLDQQLSIEENYLLEITGVSGLGP
jgi:hypothetical protein